MLEKPWSRPKSLLAFRRIFYPVRDCVSHQMQNRICQHVGERFLNPHLTTNYFEANFLSQLARGHAARE